MPLHSYSQLLTPYPSSPICSVAETARPYQFLKERHIQAMWLEQKYFRPLVTTEGFPIKVISPGVWNSEAGPDFLKAHVQIGDREWRGDIELHLADESWYQHQHHLDERYDQVILHIGYWKPDQEHLLLTHQSRKIFCTHLQNQLTIPESRLVKLIDLDLYPYKRFAGSGRCARTLFGKLSEAKTLDLFRSAAFWRLHQKKNYIQAKIEESSQWLSAGIGATLGYKHNAEAFLEIFLKLKSLDTNSVDENTLLAHGLGLCGFFNSDYQKKWKNSSYFQSLKTIYECSHEEKNLITLRLDKIRPANHPIRRLAVLAKIVADPSLKYLIEKMDHYWMDHWSLALRKGWKEVRETMLNFLPTYSDPYWEYHYSFETKIMDKPISLIGKDLKREMLINVCLPLIFDEILKRNKVSEISAFKSFYASIPSLKAKKTIYLQHRFFGDTKKDKLLMHADIQQGAYQIHRDFCVHYEASCIGCPFVERYQSSIST